MRPRARQLAIACLAAAIVGAGASATAADAQIPFAPCPGSNDFACGQLTVPLDPSGTAPGTITLAIRRHLAPVGNAKSAVVALAGGPGQAAIPFAEYFTEGLGSILSTRDLIVFDQRGTGHSHPLSCHAFEHPGGFHSFGALIDSCATQIGAERAFYTTPDSVADIEAIRRAGGYEKLVLYGTSYGTKLALQYAQEHPEHVEALILDSVVTPNGPNPLDRSTFAAVPRVLRQLCAFHECAHITRNPVRDLARLVRRMHGGSVSGRLIGPKGHARTIHITSNELLEILLAGDFDPILRAEFIAAVRAGDSGDDAPLARLIGRAESGAENETSEDIDVPLYYATTCEEESFPWSRTATAKERLAQARAQVASLPASAFAPFTAANSFALSDAGACAFWPFATPAPPVQNAPLPNVPTLILSGANDLRTPTSGARAVAEQIPDAQLLVVPNTGHSVLSTEPTSCARNALRALFAGKTIARCPLTPPAPFLRPTPLPPERLALVAPARGYHGRTGRTLSAVSLTLADFARQLLLKVLESAGTSGSFKASAVSVGGLRAGWVQIAGGDLHFHGYSYIPGVRITGTIKAESVTLRIAGRAAAGGTLRLGPHRKLVGALGGRHVQIAASPSIRGITATQARTATPDTLAATQLPDRLARLERTLTGLPAGLGEALAALPELWADRLGAES
ncbi:MAG TPA: alpha/beta fold hydrolase [Solirubrobacteraceae bacterium]|jgi:pimeloyl-ACP methyl ester carboxylesterase